MTQKIYRQHAFTISLIFNCIIVRLLTKPIRFFFPKESVDFCLSLAKIERERPRLSPRAAYDWLALVSRDVSQSVPLHHPHNE